MTLRGRVPVVVAVALLLVLSALVLQRGRADVRTSPVVAADGTGSLLMAQAATPAARTSVALGDVCAPGGSPVTVVGVDPYGVTGSLRVVDVGVGSHPDGRAVVTIPCDAGQPRTLVAIIVRGSGESAHADGFDLRYELDDEIRQMRLARPVTVCRQLSEC